MKPLEQLKNHKYYLLKIRHLQERLRAAQSVPCEGDSRLAEELLAEQHELSETILAAEKDARAAEALLQALPEKHAAVLRLRYLEGLSWKQVAKAMRYSVRRCYGISADALRQLEELNC